MYVLITVVLVEAQAVAEIVAEFIAYRFGQIFFVVVGGVAQIAVAVDLAQIGGHQRTALRHKVGAGYSYVFLDAAEQGQVGAFAKIEG